MKGKGGERKNFVFLFHHISISMLYCIGFRFPFFYLRLSTLYFFASYFLFKFWPDHRSRMDVEFGIGICIQLIFWLDQLNPTRD